MAFISAKAASGKRLRKKFDPNSWKSTPIVTRSNVLCLGVSYPCVRSQLRKFTPSLPTDFELIYKEECVEQAVELVRRNFLTEMDGRDLARILSLESGNDTMAYSVSMETGASYSSRHLTANFNRNSFFREMKRVWGGSIKFRQIILDYFWTPSGSWVMTHWSGAFFNYTIPRFVEQDILEEGGIVYLPFCLHCVEQVVASIDKLKKYYKITFFYKWELKEHILWRATQDIDPASMQNWLGKVINQEEIYCTFTARDVYSSKDNADVRKEDVLSVLRGIEDFDQVRMIKLQRLRKDEKGGFFGLLQPCDVKRGLDHQPGARPTIFAKKKARKMHKKIPKNGNKTEYTDNVSLRNRSEEATTKKQALSRRKKKMDWRLEKTPPQLSKRQTSANLSKIHIEKPISKRSEKVSTKKHEISQGKNKMGRMPKETTAKLLKTDKASANLSKSEIKKLISKRSDKVSATKYDISQDKNDMDWMPKVTPIKKSRRQTSSHLYKNAIDKPIGNRAKKISTKKPLCSHGKSKMVQMPELTATTLSKRLAYVYLSKNDVIMQKKRKEIHPGNQQFLILIRKYQLSYLEAETKSKERSCILSEVVDYFQLEKVRFVREQHNGELRIIENSSTIRIYVRNCLLRWKEISSN